MIKKIFIILFLLTTINLFCDNRAGLEWSYSFPSSEQWEAQDIKQFSTNSYMVLANKITNNDSFVYLIKLSNSGELLSSIETAINEDNLVEIEKFSDFFYIAADTHIIKSDELGNIIWDNYLDSFVDPLIKTITITDNGFCLIGGSVYYGCEDFICELDEDGEMIWFDINPASPEAGYVSSIIQVEDEYIVAGSCGYAAGPDFYVLKFVKAYNNIGNEIWNFSFQIENFSETYTSQMVYNENDIWVLNKDHIQKLDYEGNYLENHFFDFSYKNIQITSDTKLWLQNLNKIVKIDPFNGFQELSIFETDYIYDIVVGNDDKPVIIRVNNDSLFIEKIDETIVSVDDNNLNKIIYQSQLTNYPNPFNPSTTINFSIPKESNIELSVFNIKGQKVKDLVTNNFEKGNYSVVWLGKDEAGKSVSSGVYFYKIKFDGKNESVKKCLLLK